MKKISIILLTFALVFTSFGPVFAAEAESNEEETAQSGEVNIALEDEGGGALDEDTGISYQQEQSAYNNFKKEAGLSGSLRVDNFSGAAVYNLALEIPKGRGGLQPSLNLYYNSHDKSGGSWVGLGWSLDLGYIIRSSRKGTNNLFTSNEYTLFLNGKSCDLVLTDSQNSLYGCKVESDYLKIQYLSASASWLVTDTLGTKYYFGQEQNTRQDNSDHTLIYKWMLDRTEDTNSNFYALSYIKDQNQIYPSSINYTGHEVTNGPMTITFNLTDQPAFLSYQAQFPVTTAKILSSILVQVNSQDKLKYEFVYTSGQISNQKLLQSVTKKAYQNSVWQSLPATSFSYQNATHQWLNDTGNWSDIPYFNVDDGDTPNPLMDINSDSWVDFGSQLHTGTGWNGSSYGLPPVGDLYEHSITTDINGDKYPDMIVNHWGWGNPWGSRVYLNDRVGNFNYDAAWTNALPSFFNGRYNGQYAFEFVTTSITDINGDGLADIVYAYNEQTSSTKITLLNTGSGWTGGYGNFPTTIASCTPYSFPGCNSTGAQIVDINGDGLADVFNGGVYLNTGSGWENTLSTTWQAPTLPTGFTNAWEWGGARLTDVNSDGLTDIAVAAESYFLHNGGWSMEEYFVTYLNNGQGWIQNNAWNLPLSVGYNQTDLGTRLMDINNDGLMDEVESHRNYPGTSVDRDVRINLSETANILTQINNGYGGQTQIEYQASGQYFYDDNTFKNPKLPLNLQTVKQITINDGVGNETITAYDYQDGAYYYDTDYTLNQFAGFGIVTEQTGDKIIKTYYHQGGGLDYYDLGEYEDSVYKKGRVFREEVYQITAEETYILSHKINTFKQTDLGNGRKFVYLDSSVSHDYEDGVLAPENRGGQDNGNTEQAQYLSDLQKKQNFWPTREPQLISESADGWSKTYYLGETPAGEPIYQLQVFSGQKPKEGRLDDPEYESGSADGFVYNNVSGSQNSWSSTVNSPTGTGSNSSNSVAELYNHWHGGIGGPHIYISRVFLPFDTSLLPDEPITITQAQLKLSVNTALNSGQAHIVKSEQTSGNLTAATYGTLLNSESGGLIYVDGGASNPRISNLNALGVSWISQTNWTNLGLRLDWDYENSEPTYNTDHYSTIITSESGSASDWPTLLVIYIFDNANPLAPTELWTENQVNPVEVADTTPEFSAIFNDSNSNDLATAYRIEVYRADYFTGTTTLNLVWDSGQQSMASSTPVGQRIPDITYNPASPLPLDGWQYFWRLKFWDNGGPLTNEGLWSDYGSFAMDGSLAPSAPISLLTEGRVNPQDLLNITPSFSAIYTDPNPIDMAKWYQVQVSTDANFTNLVWDSPKTLLNQLINNGQRSEEIVYNGSLLVYDGQVYHWRIKFWDDEGENGTQGAWSAPATFSMFNQAEVLTNGEARAVKYVYGDYGNVLSEENLGKVNAANNGVYLDTGSDKRITTYQYAQNQEKHILSAPKNKLLSNQSGSQTLNTDLYYDNLPMGQIDKVNLTKEDLTQAGAAYESDFNDYGLPIVKRDPLNHETVINYDSNNYYPTSAINALNQAVLTAYDLTTGQVLSTTDPNGLVEQKSYDGFGRLLEIKRSDPASPTNLIVLELYEYQDTVAPFYVKKSTRVDNTNWVDSYTYFDGLGRVIQTRIEAAGINQYIVVSSKYDESGNLEAQTLPIYQSGLTYQPADWPTAVKTSYTYDSLGRPLLEITPVGQTSYQYDGWETIVTDPNGKVKKYYNDAFGNLERTDEILSGQTYSTYYSYNHLDKIVKIKDSQNNERNFTYDSLGRLLSQEEMHKPSATTWGNWTFVYDLASNLTSKTDPKNQTVSFTYDNLNRQLTEDANTTGQLDISYVYDTAPYGIGRLASATKNTSPTVISSYVYDIWGRTTTETKNIKDRIFITNFAYALNNQPLTITYPDNFIARYTYNQTGQTNQVYIQAPGQAEQSIVTSVDYSAIGQIQEIDYQNGTESVMTYDINEAYRLIAKETTTPTTTLQDLSYTYDNVGNITQITDTAPNQLAKTSTFEYDDLYRLTNAQIIDNFTPTTTLETLSYDIIGNILTKSDIGAYQYLNNNPYQASNIAGANYAYDLNGNLTNDGVRTMAYNYQDRMSNVIVDGRTMNYYYDHSKTRVVKHNPQSGYIKFYPNKYFEKETTSEKTKYVFLGNQRLAIVNSEGTHLNFSDHLNSSSVTTDTQGNVTNLNDYLPYGADRVNIQVSGNFDNK